MPNIKPVSDLRNYGEVLRDVAVGQPVFLTRNGHGRYAVLDIEEYRQYEKLLAMQKLMEELERGRRSGEDQGYVNAEDMKRAPGFDTELTFSYEEVTVNARCKLTDDPARTKSTIVTLKKGTTVTYLTTYFNAEPWAYIETEVKGKTVRGFIPAECIDAALVDDAEIDDDETIGK